MGWKESLSITIAAQLAVAPILIGQFGNFTLTSFLSNILILFTVPVENDKVRYCMNSAALRFIKKEDLKEKGYGKYLALFKKS